MARQQVGHIAPFINVDFYVTSTFGEVRTSSIHRGLDIATSIPASIYSVSAGTVYYKGFDSSGYGHYIIIKNSNDDKGFLYAHMASASPLNVGQAVRVGEYIGLEGTSGSSTGVHLHIEYQVMINGEWTYSSSLSDYLNPAVFMGITNVVDHSNSWYYNGVPIPPSENKHRRNYNFVLYAKKIRERANF